MSAVDFVSQIPSDDMNYFILLEKLGGGGETRRWSKLDGTWSEAQVSPPQMWYWWLDSCSCGNCSFTFWSILTCLLLEEEKRFIFFFFLASSLLWSPNSAALDAVKTDFGSLALNSCLWLRDVSIPRDGELIKRPFLSTKCLLCHPSWIFWTPSPCSCTVDKRSWVDGHWGADRHIRQSAFRCEPRRSYRTLVPLKKRCYVW